MGQPPKTDLALAARHKYRLLDGRLAISVTSVIGFADDGKSARLAHAAAKIGPDFRAQWDAKAATGTRIHGYMESWMAGDHVDAPEEDWGYLDHLEQFVKDYEVSPLLVESIVLNHTHGYGGRLDVIAQTAMGTGLIDLKTGSPYLTDLTLQLNAYSVAEVAVYDDAGTLAGVEDLPRVDFLAGLYVTPGGYNLVEVEYSEEAHAAFVSLLTAKRAYAELNKRAKEGKP